MVGYEIVQKLGAKGFCVVWPGLEDDQLTQALEEVKAFDTEQRWSKVATAIQDGLLGAEGSFQIVELEPVEAEEDEAVSREDMLTRLGDTITHVGFRMEPHLEQLGITVSHRSLTVVHRAGEPDEEEEGVALTEKQCMKWLAQFMRHRLMVIIFLGPVPGTMELKPYDMPEADMYEIKTKPGTLVVVRPDILSHRHFSPGRSIAMSAFFLTGYLPKRAPSEGFHMVPAAQELDEWTLNRLKDLKEQRPDDAPWSPDIPRDWEHAMNHLYHKGQWIAVRGMANKCSMCDDPETFWQVSTAGPDYVCEVPHMRWDHSEVYDPDMESWKLYKSYCKHVSYMEGIELFDCKVFSMSPNEAKSMDPHQRLILDIGYAALINMGMKKSNLVNSACGVYVGCGNLEWSSVPKDDVAGAFGATGGALSISSGRFSFTLGLKGPSMTLDTEASSGATAIFLAGESVTVKGRATAQDMALAVGASMVLSPQLWPTYCAEGALSKEGRCLTFNSSAAGYIRGDGVAAVALKTFTDVVDGDQVQHDEEDVPGALAGATMNNNGIGASLTAPWGPAEQEAIATAVRNASVSGCDVDGVEAFGSGSFLADAIEVGSLLRAHRTRDMRDPLAITAVKSSLGNQIESSGICSFIKTILSAQWGNVTPNLHLWQVNPNIEAFDQPCAFATQCFEYRLQSNFSGNMSRGTGGSNVYLLTWGQISVDKVPPPAPASEREVLAFWPGGGGQLEAEQRPTREYTIVGSWGQWPEPMPMEPEGDGVYGYTVTLGENRWESFVIWLDGNSTKVLHPGHPRASKDFPVLGPVEDAEGACWTINAYRERVYVPYVEGETPIDDFLEIAENEYGERVAVTEVPTADTGLPGEQYRIRLRIVGRWRTVTWEKLTSGTVQDELEAANAIAGTYYLMGDATGWQLERMNRDPEIRGLFFKEVKLIGRQSEFQIIRNRDWNQVIYPEYVLAADGTINASSTVLGPDDMGQDFTWVIRGESESRWTIQFQRAVEGGRDAMQVSWHRADDQALRAERPERGYSMVGTWDEYRRPREMRWDGESFRLYVQLGPSGRESFQLLESGRIDRTLHPDRPGATPYSEHLLRGPDQGADGLSWTVGSHEFDAGEPGHWFLVRLLFSEKGEPWQVRWQRHADDRPPASDEAYAVHAGAA